MSENVTYQRIDKNANRVGLRSSQALIRSLCNGEGLVAVVASLNQGVPLTFLCLLDLLVFDLLIVCMCLCDVHVDKLTGWSESLF